MIIRKAETRQDLEAVWRLTHDVYVAEGYASPRPDGMLRHYPHLDAIPETAVFLALDDCGRLLGSNSHTVDGPAGLQVDDDFKDVADAYRERCRLSGERLAASWRIVTRPGCREQLAVVMKLISVTVEHSLQCADHVLFTFNPKHEGFYRRMLGLKTVAGPRDGHSVKGAPAILMHNRMDDLAACWERVVARRSSARLAGRSAPAPVAAAV